MGEIHDILLIDVIPLTLGFNLVGDIFKRVIPKNTSIPV
jgi:molecular chaperone DnaK